MIKEKVIVERSNDKMIDSAYVASLTSPTATNISLFGAKAANLAKATQLGFSVPDGLVVSIKCTEDEFALIAKAILDELYP
ncbi:MAG: hypothetical protein FWG21_03145, partial [Oscillospiraceae bacterium]|nr:hypothetical protein [Oscillospiraceae bacterium]